MVIYEAAKALCELPQIQNRDLTSAYTVLQLFLSSSKAPTRYAALKTLNRLAQNNPKYLQSSYQDFESLINDQNRNIASLAISTLLKVSNESNVEKMLKQITSYMNDATDDFKIDVIKSIKTLAIRMSSKNRSLIQFIFKRMKEEGSYELKKNCFQAILSISEINQESKDFAIGQLVEYIEDCEYDLLLNQILFEIGQQGPSLHNPSRFIRNIYNRIILEKPPVRAAAVSALSKFGQIPGLRQRITGLLQKCLQDSDDEVRERSSFFIKKLDELEAEYEQNQSQVQQLKLDLPISIEQLQQAILEWNQQDRQDTFKIQNIVVPTQAQEQQAKPKQVEKKQKKEQQQEVVVQKKEKDNQNEVLQRFGKPIFVSPEIQLTEQTAEYVTVLIKYVYQDKFVLEVKVKNTLDSVNMENVFLDIQSQEFKIQDYQAAKEIPRNSEGSAYLVLERPSKFKSESFPAKLKFTVKEMEGEDVVDTFEDEYKLENISIKVSDF